MIQWIAGWPAWSLHHPWSFVIYGALMAGFAGLVWLGVRYGGQ